MQSQIMRPLINLNGTSPDSLIQSRLDAREALLGLMRALDAIAPNGRDYIGTPGAYDTDLAIHRGRFTALDSLYNALGDEALDIQARA
jgi:hypothetical protein